MYDLSFDPQALASLNMGKPGIGLNPMNGLTGGGFLDPRMQGLLGAAASILSASGPSTTPTNLGQIAGKGFMGGTQSFQQARQGQMQELQGALLTAQLKKSIEGQDLWAKMFQPPATTPSAPSADAGVNGISDSSAAAIGAPWAAASTLPQTNPQAPQPPAGIPPQGPNLSQIGALGGIDPERAKFALEWWKANNPDVKIEGGVALDPKTGLPKANVPTIPQTNQQGFSTFLKFNPQSGQYEVNLTPGGTSAYGTQADIAEAAKARRDPVMGVQDAQGRPVPMTRENFAQRYGGVSAPGAGPSVGGVAPVPSPAPAGVGPSIAQRTSAETIGKNDAERVTALEQKIPSQLSTLRRLDRMESLTKDDQTFAAKGAELKKEIGSLVQAFGLKVDAGKTANTEAYLAHVGELLKDRLGSKDYGSGSGVSNLDLISAQGPLPELAKTAQGRLAIISAIRADTQRNLADAQSARDFYDSNHGSLRGFRFPSEVEAGNQRRTNDLKKITQGGAQPQSTQPRLKYNFATGKIE
jgi:hypothetical protein